MYTPTNVRLPPSLAPSFSSLPPSLPSFSLPSLLPSFLPLFLPPSLSPFLSLFLPPFIPPSLPPVGKDIDYVRSRTAALSRYLTLTGGGSFSPNPSMPLLHEAWTTLIPDHIRKKQPHPGSPILVGQAARL